MAILNLHLSFVVCFVRRKGKKFPDILMFSKLFVSRVLNNEVVQISPLNSFNLEANTQSNVVYEKNNLIFKKGSVALARDIHDNNSASFDFFITLKAKPLLDRKYVIFAKVIEGFDTLYNLKKNDKIIYTSLE